ncbi:rhodanese-like domain-containing protein [Nostoc sp.]|uniref:rhodanese-like domain-containing protein n=1 Tax=Nostoc sp. TaxID=1180 RepID=UPI003593151A
MTNKSDPQLKNFKESTRDQLKTIEAQKLKHSLEHNSVILVDVREPSEHAGEKIIDSVLVPLSNFDPAKVPIDPTKPIVLYCQSGKRSAQAAQKLISSGVGKVYHLEGGLNQWKQKGYSTQVNKNAPISMMRQVQIAAGFFVFTGTVLGAIISPWFLILSGFVGAGLMFAGITNTCAMAMLLAKLPYNQRA